MTLSAIKVHYPTDQKAAGLTLAWHSGQAAPPEQDDPTSLQRPLFSKSLRCRRAVQFLAEVSGTGKQRKPKGKLLRIWSWPISGFSFFFFLNSWNKAPLSLRIEKNMNLNFEAVWMGLRTCYIIWKMRFQRLFHLTLQPTTLVIRPSCGYCKTWFISSYLVGSWECRAGLGSSPRPNAPQLSHCTLCMKTFCLTWKNKGTRDCPVKISKGWLWLLL